MRKMLFILLLLAAPLAAVEPSEILADPQLESRARDISKELRCLVCRNESIDESHADLAKDLRILVRERLVLGDSNEATIAYIVDRYGEYVLLEPNKSGSNLILWGAGPALLLFGLGIGFVFVRRRKPVAEIALSDAEKQRLSDIIDGS